MDTEFKTKLTLEERLTMAYPDGAPELMVKFLRGERVARTNLVRSEIKVRSEELERMRLEAERERNRRMGAVSFHESPIVALQRNLETRRRELAEVLAYLNSKDFIHKKPMDAGAKLGEKVALEIMIARIEQELAEMADRERRESEQERQQAGQISNWAVLLELAQTRLQDDVPSIRLAAEFGSTPEQIVTAERWQAHLAEQEAAKLEAERKREEQRLAMERVRQEEEERKRKAAEEVEYVNSLDIKSLLAIAYPREVPHEIAIAFVRREIGGGVRERIYNERNRFRGDVNRKTELACTRLLELAEEMNPTPEGGRRWL